VGNERGIILDKSGSTADHIKFHSGLKDLWVKSGENNKNKVVLRGPKEGVKTAEKTVEEMPWYWYGRREMTSARTKLRKLRHRCMCRVRPHSAC